MRVVRKVASVSPSEPLRGKAGDPRSSGAASHSSPHPQDGLVETAGPDCIQHADASTADASFPRNARLLKAGDFARLRGISRRIGSRHFSVEVAVNTHETARLGLAISKRVSKKAVRRNRIKRIARDSFRRTRNSLPAVDILLIARSSADLEQNATLREELVRLWERIATFNGAGLNVAGGAGTMRD
jgi:ribonuclease P protein component